MQEQTKSLNYVSLPELTHTYTHTREVEYELVRGREAEGRHEECCCLNFWAAAALLYIAKPVKVS